MAFRLRSFVCAMVLAGCTADGGTGTVQGRVTNSDGAQARSLGGSGTVAATVKVRLATVGDDGRETVVGTADVGAGGAYSISSSAVGETKMVIDGLDAQGEVTASVILEQGLTAGETTTAAPMT